MCGISFILSNSVDGMKMDGLISILLASRGPDITYAKEIKLDEQLLCQFRGSVLWMQGKTVQEQPVLNDFGDVFLWNGDCFNSTVLSSEESDTLTLFKKFELKTEEEIVTILAEVEGPWSFIYYSHKQQKVYFGRDMLGRHSLLWTPFLNEKNSPFILCSVAQRQLQLQEVPALGIYVADVRSLLSEGGDISLYPYNYVTNDQLFVNNLKNIKILNYQLRTSIQIPLCKEIPSDSEVKLLQSFPPSFSNEKLFIFSKYLSTEIKLFDNVFSKSIKKRVDACPPKCTKCTYSTAVCRHAKYAVLFSGGLDSALIACYLTKCLPPDEPIDLLNVSFECRRSIASSKKRSTSSDVSFDFLSPDRLSGLDCLKELKKLDEKRTWNFVEINVSTEELKTARKLIISDLVAPQSTVLDDSIGCALFFCSRGSGILNGTPYTSPARVVFSGLGADEQLGGYARHRARFSDLSWKGLLDEIELEMSRIHERNCGRDDRVLSHHGRSARFPYLDEEVVSCLNSIPVWKKANLYMPRGIGEKILLRVIAACNGLLTSATLPKRAIQFGSRIAKLENKKEKGNDICQKLQDITL